MTVDRAVGALLAEALELYRDNPRACAWLQRQLDKLAEPLRLAVIGPEGTGKSTVVSALIGEEIAPVIAEDGLAVPGWYRGAPEARATLLPRQGAPWEIPMSWVAGRLRYDLAGRPAAAVDRVEVTWPAGVLRQSTIIDLPGTEDGAAKIADAVLYLTPHVADADLRALHALVAHPVAGAAPVAALLVLSRADEIHGGQVDALTTARQLARKHAADPGLGAVCQGVVPVSGLLGLAGRTLLEAEVAAFRALAEVDRAELDPYLLSADRFVSTGLPSPVAVATRVALLRRFGLPGLRLVLALVRQGFGDHPALAAELVRRSGIDELREHIARCFTSRARVLKARSALIAVDLVLRTETHPATPKLIADAERLLTSTHEFQELRLLAALHTGRVQLPADLDTDARRLLGGQGTEPPDRLGVDPRGANLLEAAQSALYRWQIISEDPTLASWQRTTARSVARSAAGIVTQLRGR
jgi:hypothetical protein